MKKFNHAELCTIERALDLYQAHCDYKEGYKDERELALKIKDKLFEGAK